VSTGPAAIAEQTGIVPIRLVVGVTGPRALAQQDKLGEKVQAALGMIRDIVKATVEDLRKELKEDLPEIPVVFRGLSPLAEGADRLVAREVLRTPGGQLEAILPLPQADYESDFRSATSPPGSLDEFRKLFDAANLRRELPHPRQRPDVYLDVGQYVADHCDILIALWDGEQSAGAGGTGEIFAYAQRNSRPIIWIDTLQWEKDPLFVKGEGLKLKAICQIARYNAESVGAGEFHREVAAESERLLAVARETGYSPSDLRSICDYLLPYYVRADRLAQDYRARYQSTGEMLHFCAVAAVAVLAGQALFLPHDIWPVLVEMVVIVLGLYLWLRERRGQWQMKYIDYRFLAERFRATIFMAAAEMERTGLEAPRYLSLTFSESDWVVSAFSAVRDLVPHPIEQRNEPGFDRLRRFLSVAWIDRQINYHRSTQELQEKMGRRGERFVMALVVGTLVSAFLHIMAERHLLEPLGRRLGVGAIAAHLPGWAAWLHVRLPLNLVFTWLAIVLPALAAAVSAIRNQREHEKISRRSGEMVHHLEELKSAMNEAADRDTFLECVREADETMLYENEDWRVVVRFRANEPLA
jgi:hypothetical protein